jgi:phosphatidate cytidylyltransferase
MPAIPRIDLVLASLLLLLAPVAAVLGRRGGRFRGLTGWLWAWTQFSVLVVALSRAMPAISFTLLGIVMFVALKQYYFLTPLRPQDRWAIFLSYVSVPLALWPAWAGSFTLLSGATVVGLFLLIPVLLSISPRQPGLLDSLGRVLLGEFVFVFCAAHFGLMTQLPSGCLELFAIVALPADLAQRLIGRMRPGTERVRPLLGLVVSAAIAAATGYLLAGDAGLIGIHGAGAGLLAALGTAAGSLVCDAVAQDLDRSPGDALLGRAAFLDRTLPLIYAAPAFYHYVRTITS